MSNTLLKMGKVTLGSIIAATIGGGSGIATDYFLNEQDKLHKADHVEVTFIGTNSYQIKDQRQYDPTKFLSKIFRKPLKVDTAYTVANATEELERVSQNQKVIKFFDNKAIVIYPVQYNNFIDTINLKSPQPK